jgi:hypothetical protein
MNEFEENSVHITMVKMTEVYMTRGSLNTHYQIDLFKTHIWQLLILVKPEHKLC